jgi:hypothetical protein
MQPSREPGLPAGQRFTNETMVRGLAEQFVSPGFRQRLAEVGMQREFLP